MSRVPKPKPARCKDCFFHKHMLCALNLDKPCTTFPVAAPTSPPSASWPFVFRTQHHGGLRVPAAQRLGRLPWRMLRQ